MRPINMRRSVMAALGAAALVVGPLAPAYAFPVVSSDDREPVGVAAEVPAADPTAEPGSRPQPGSCPQPRARARA